MPNSRLTSTGDQLTDIAFADPPAMDTGSAGLATCPPPGQIACPAAQPEDQAHWKL